MHTYTDCYCRGSCLLPTATAAAAYRCLLLHALCLLPAAAALALAHFVSHVLVLINLRRQVKLHSRYTSAGDGNSR